MSRDKKGVSTVPKTHQLVKKLEPIRAQVSKRSSDAYQRKPTASVAAEGIFEWGANQFARAPESAGPPLGAEGPPETN